MLSLFWYDETSPGTSLQGMIWTLPLIEYVGERKSGTLRLKMESTDRVGACPLAWVSHNTNRSVRHCIKKEKSSMRQVDITKEPVELFKILKFEGIVASGGQAKLVIGDGQVTVNGEVETRKRRKIMGGDIITFGDEELRIRLAD